MSTAAFASVPVPEVAPPGSPVEPEFLTHLSDRLGPPPGAADPPPSTPAVPAEPPAPVVPSEPAPRTPIQDPAPGPVKETAVRLENKELKTRLETYEKELAELREKAGKLPELETSLTETRTLAEQREAERKRLEESYRNEVTKVPDEILMEVPEFVEAKNRFEEKAAGLFPAYITDPNDDEELDVPFNFQNLPQGAVAAIGGYLNEYEDTLAAPNQEIASQTRNALISAMAKVMGVKAEKFVPKPFRGQEFDFLPKSHPVYQHLFKSLSPFLEQRAKMNQIKDAALKNSDGSYQQAATGRIDNTRTLFKNFGVSLSPEEVDQALTKTPDNLTLQAMKALQAYPELMEEVKANLEHEANLNGHFRPVLDIHDLDPASRTAKAQAALSRIGKRAGYAPIVEPVLKLLIRTQKELADLKKAKAEAEAEASRARINIEPGAGGGYEGGAATPDTTGNAYLDELRSKLPR